MIGCVNRNKTDRQKKIVSCNFNIEQKKCINRCGNINWARRTTCNMCNMPKIQKTEVRTGTGGGYNERENVEYKERVESDDEYDDVRTIF